MKYKKSKYNIFVPYEDSKTIIFNSLTGSIGLFDEETMEKYNNDTFSLEETELLLKKGILVDCGYDELSKVNNDRVNGIKYTKGKFIRVWTTSACNARCYYCFEKGIATTKMTKETADQLVVFIDNMLNDGDKLTFEWFGGEPLLNVEIIDYIEVRMVSNLYVEYQLSVLLYFNDRATVDESGAIIFERNYLCDANTNGIEQKLTLGSSVDNDIRASSIIINSHD